jgi:Family of unknown function (DUF5691)
MIGWNELLNTAIIGTDKKNLAQQSLPQEVQQYLIEPSAERNLLIANTLSHFAKQAGVVSSTSSDIKEILITDEKEYASENYMSILKEIQNLEKHDDILTKNWLLKLKAQHKIIPPANVLSLIKKVNNYTKSVKELFIALAGNTGTTLLSFLPEYDFKIADKTNTWEEGSSDARLIFLMDVRKDNAEKSLELIAQTWATESIAFKKNILSLMQHQPSAPEVHWAQELLETEFAFQDKETKTVSECRYLCACIVLQNESSKLYISTQHAFHTYITTEQKGFFQKLVGNKTASTFNLPATDDAFFNAENLFTVYGIPKQNSRSQFFSTDNLYRLSELIQLLPITFWTNLLQQDINDVLSYFLSNTIYQVTTHGQTLPCLEQALAISAGKYKNHEQILAMLSRSERTINYDIAKHLPQAQGEAFAIKNDLLMDEQFLRSIVSYKEEWSENFSNLFLKNTFDKIVKQNQYVYESWIHLYSNCLNTKCTTVLDQLFTKDETAAHKVIWDNHIYKKLKPFLDTKIKLQNI